MGKEETKAHFRLHICLNLLVIGFTIYALAITLDPSILKTSFFTPLQLTLSIPLLLSSMFARSKYPYTRRNGMWKTYGDITFLLAYAFLINVAGILLAFYVSVPIAMIFFGFNIFMSVTYSFFDIVEDKRKIISRIRKDLAFAIILFLGGVLPSLNFHF